VTDACDLVPGSNDMPIDPRARAPKLSLTIWGCRGSVSVGGAGSQRYGGMTTCIELETPDHRLIIDAGSGLPALGRVRGADRKQTLMLMTHLHWDHVIGLPHYSPLFVDGWDLQIRGVPREGHSVLDWMMDFNRPPAFPVDLRTSVRANVTGADMTPQGHDTFGPIAFAWREVEHPGGCTAFRLEVAGQVIVFSGDLELGRMDPGTMREFCAGADVLICDAQYTDEEYPAYVGWGHSTHRQAAKLAHESGVGELLLSHHDPRHDDVQIDRMAEQAREIFASTRSARCGEVVIHLPSE